jgi:lactoylglutathione lyase
MKEITNINHIGLRVRDLEISRKFYQGLGFKFIMGPVGPEPVAVVMHSSGVNFNLILNASKEAPPENILMSGEIKYPGYTHIALEVTDAESALQFVLNLGIPVTEEVEFEGAKFFFIRDPDNNVIEFHQPSGS